MNIPTPELPEIDSAPQVLLPSAAEGLPGWVLPSACAAVALITLGAALFFLSNRRKKQIPPEIRDAPSEAMRQLHDLRGKAREMAPPEFTRRISEILRTFLQRQFGIRARYQTSQEILALRRRVDLPPPPPPVLAFQELMLDCDFVHYSAAASAEQTPESFVDRAILLVRRSAESAAHPPAPVQHAGLPF